MIAWGFFSTSVISLPLIFVWLPDRFISVPQQQLILQLEVMTFLWWQSGVWYCSSDSWVHLWPAFPAYFIRLSSLSFSYFSYEEAPTCKVKKDKHGQHEVLISWAEVQSHQLIYHMTREHIIRHSRWLTQTWLRLPFPLLLSCAVYCLLEPLSMLSGWLCSETTHCSPTHFDILVSCTSWSQNLWSNERFLHSIRGK